ncbi:MAG: BamA/TamA family outer membrane protein [Bacteroidota bacterium]|nr:BamA/TamA family outer membrane protein [Bacteroidota bacterium]
MQINKYIFLVIVFLICKSIFPNPTDSIKFKIGALPSAFYTPETRFGFGGLIYTYFKFGKNDSLTKKSNTQSYASYTLNKQIYIENDYRIWTKSNLYYFTGSLDFSRFPEYFYGVGNDTKTDERIMISFDIFKIKAKNLKLLHNNIYGGVFYQYQKLYNQNVAIVASEMCETTTGAAGYKASGIGPIFIFDKRDNPLNPESGAYVETSFQYFNKQIGSETNFKSFILDVRKYKTFFKKLVWNGNVYVHVNKGEVPFRMLATIGGARFLRGYYNGRFRDNNMIIMQKEMRLPVYKRLGIAVFGGLGAVSKTLPDFYKNEIHYNYGAGLRIKINKKENTNLRIDYGLTKDSQGLYVVFAEAF